MYQVYNLIVSFDVIYTLYSPQHPQQKLEVIGLLMIELPYIKIQQKVKFVSHFEIVLHKIVSLKVPLQYLLKSIKPKQIFITPIFLNEVYSFEDGESVRKEVI